MYDELTVYLHGLAFLLLIVLSNDFHNMVVAFALSGRRASLLLLLIPAGTLLSIVDPLLKRKKSRNEKAVMLGFIVVSNLFTGLYGLAVSADPETHQIGVFQIPLLINVIYSVGLMAFWSRGSLSGSGISDETPPAYQVAIITFSILASFGIFDYMLGMAWSVAYSWCIFVGLVVKHVMDFLAVELSPIRSSHGPAANSQKEDAHHGR